MIRLSTLLLSLSMALPAHAAELIDRQLQWFTSHDGQEIALPDGSLAVPFTLTSTIWWLEPDGKVRDVGRIGRNKETDELVIEWASFGPDHISADPMSADFPFKPTGQASTLANDFAAILNAALQSPLGLLPKETRLEPNGAIRIPSVDNQSTVAGQWELLGDAIRITLQNGEVEIHPISEVLNAIETQ